MQNRQGPAANDRQRLLVDGEIAPGCDNYNYAIYGPGGVYIGRAILHGRDTGQGVVLQIDHVLISTDLRGKGYGRSLYKELLKSMPLGTELACDPRGVAPDTIKVWGWLETNGLAKRPSNESEPFLSINGKYQNLAYVTQLTNLWDQTLS